MAAKLYSTFEVTCPCDTKFKFEKRVQVEPGSSHQESTVIAFCSYCGKYLEVDIKGNQQQISVQRTTRKA